MVQCVGSQLFTVLIHKELFRGHFTSQEFIVLPIVLHVEVVLLFAIANVLWLDLWSETLNFFVLRHRVLLLLQAHHPLDHLEAGELLFSLHGYRLPELVQLGLGLRPDQVFPECRLVQLWVVAILLHLG